MIITSVENNSDIYIYRDIYSISICVMQYEHIWTLECWTFSTLILVDFAHLLETFAKLLQNLDGLNLAIGCEQVM